MKFPTGEILFTSYLYVLMQKNFLFNLFVFEPINRHMAGDWGNCCQEDKKSNNQALYNGNRIFSVYTIPKELKINKQKIWIIIEWDRSVTTILFPDEY